MEKMLVKLSRRRSLMVPVVTLLAIGIGISGYYIQNQQIKSREQQAQGQHQDQPASPAAVDSSQLSTKETVDESTKVTEDGQAAEVVTVELEVENKPENSEVELAAKVDTKKVGSCVFTLKQANYGPEETVPVKDSKCTVRLQNPGDGTWEAKVLYTSDDGKTRGDAKAEIQL